MLAEKRCGGNDDDEGKNRGLKFLFGNITKKIKEREMIVVVLNVGFIWF